jgi:hypothetical protein
LLCSTIPGAQPFMWLSQDTNFFRTLE